MHSTSDIHFEGVDEEELAYPKPPQRRDPLPSERQHRIGQTRRPTALRYTVQPSPDHAPSDLARPAWSGDL